MRSVPNHPSRGCGERGAIAAAGVCGASAAAEREHALERFAFQAQAHPFGQPGDHAFAEAGGPVGPGDAARRAAGSASGSSCSHAGVPAGASAGSLHQLASTRAAAGAFGLEEHRRRDGRRSVRSPRAPSIQMPSLVTVSSWALIVGGSPVPGTVNGSSQGCARAQHGDRERMRFSIARAGGERHRLPAPVPRRAFDAAEQRDRAARVVGGELRRAARRWRASSRRSPAPGSFPSCPRVLRSAHRSSGGHPSAGPRSRPAAPSLTGTTNAPASPSASSSGAIIGARSLP